jgi:hypothetical protein
MAAYDLRLDSLSGPVRLPYWTDLRSLDYSTTYRLSHPNISVVHPAFSNGAVQCILSTGSHVQLMEIPLPTSSMATPATHYISIGSGIRRWESDMFLSSTVGVLGLRLKTPNLGHSTLVFRTNMEQGRGHTRLGSDRDEWMTAGVLLRDVANKWHVDISFDEDTGHVLILSNKRTSETDYSSDYSTLSLLSVI